MQAVPEVLHLALHHPNVVLVAIIAVAVARALPDAVDILRGFGKYLLVKPVPHCFST